ncbi:MAG: trypsin-like peptidase domain-containing protein [Oscillospiraceae bacterium]|nr:trypsin-like peptidase domain-containing protein [Oscillospiraceae bacterium]
MKKIISLILCFALVVGFVPMNISNAAARSYRLEEELAKDLKALGLFKGVSETDFALNRAPTRTEALVMLIRVLGRENDALAKGGKHPFTDVPAWASKYVGYAYENKLTNGMSATKFGSNAEASSSMYLTFVLRALGYSDTTGADFTWDNPYTLARTTGILRGNPDTLKFMRGDVVLVSYAALEALVKGTSQTLAEKLMASGVFTAAEYDKYYDLEAFDGADSAKELTAEEISKACSPAVFYIEVYDKNGRAFASGSGFFIDSNGTAVTNHHVIEGAASAKIKCAHNGNVYKVEGVYDYDVKNDWAIIKVNGKDFPYLEINEEVPVSGSTVFAIGSPLGLDNTISQGIVSNAKRTLDGVDYIQISAAISHGSSGGALIDKYGDVIGITSAGFDDGQNLNLAIPISAIKGFTADKAYPLSAIDTAASSAASSNGRPLGNIDIDPSDEKAVFDLLAMFVLNFRNDTYGDNPAYALKVPQSDGSVHEYYLSYNEGEEELSVTLFNQYDGSLVAATVDISRRSDRTTAFMAYYSDTRYSSDFIGLEYIDKDEYKDGMMSYFTEYDGDYEYKSQCEDAAPGYYMSILYFIETLLTEDLSGYGIDDGVYSLGFTRCYFD